MEQIFEQVLLFALANGWQLGLIAFLGIVLLGVLKYADVFSSVEKANRKPIYLGISVGLSLLGTVAYLAIVGQFQIDYIVGIATTIYTLNQAMYAVYENTKLRDLWARALEFITNKIKKK